MTRQKMRWTTGALAAGLLLAAAGVVLSAPKKGSTLTVLVLSARVMVQPKLIGAAAATVSRGAHLAFGEAKGDWYKVKTQDGKEGWVNRADVTEGAVTLSSKPGGGSGGASQDEVELAGRGFTPEVEESYRGKHPDMKFEHVDAIEATSVDPAALAAFVAEGQIVAPGGGK